MEDRLDKVRAAALDRIAKSERNFKLLLFGAASWEVAFLAAFLLLMQPHDRGQLLLLLATVGSYSLVVLALVALGAYFDRGNLRLLKSIEMLSEELGDER